jgi:hypothetical protein
VSGGVASARSGYASTISTAASNYTAVNASYTEIAAINPVSLSSKSALDTAKEHYDALSSNTMRTKVDTALGNGNTIASKQAAYTGLVNTEAGEITGYLAALSPLTVDSGTAVSNAETAIARSTMSNSDVLAAVRAYDSNYSTTVSNARAIYDAIKAVYDLIVELPAAAEVTAGDQSAIEAARAAYDALENHVQGDLRSYLSAYLSRLTDAEAALAALTSGPSAADMAAAITNFENTSSPSFKFDPSKDDDILALEAYATKNADEWAKVSPEVQAMVAAIREDYTAVHAVYEAIEDDLPAAVHLNSYNAIYGVKTLYDALSSDRQTLLRTGANTNYSDLTAAIAAFDEIKPTAEINVIPGSSKIMANFYVQLPTDEISYASDFTLYVDGVSMKLNNSSLTATAETVGANTRYAITVTKAARRMTDPIYYYLEVNTPENDEDHTDRLFQGSTTIEYYCTQILKTPAYVAYHDIARCMLIYGGAAQVYFGYETSNRADKDLAATLAAADISASTTPTAKSGITGTKFDATPIRHVTNNVDSCPVGYSAYNITFEADTRILISFRIKDPSTEEKKNQALDWVKSHISFGGNTGSALNASIETGTDYSYVWISLRNIPISDLAVNNVLAVMNDSGAVISDPCTFSVMNYVYIASLKGNANLSYLTRALYDYYNAVNALATAS